MFFSSSPDQSPQIPCSPCVSLYSYHEHSCKVSVTWFTQVTSVEKTQGPNFVKKQNLQCVVTAQVVPVKWFVLGLQGLFMTEPHSHTNRPWCHVNALVHSFPAESSKSLCGRAKPLPSFSCPELSLTDFMTCRLTGRQKWHQNGMREKTPPSFIPLLFPTLPGALTSLLFTIRLIKQHQICMGGKPNCNLLELMRM